MVTALIFAGGTGQRMNSRSRPKQFLELHGKPIIIYTLEHFEEHPEVDKIAIVCLESWIDELKGLLNRHDIRKVCLIAKGGNTGHESIYNGLKALEGVCKEEDIILIHDGVRPLITEDLITDNIAKVRQYGTAITVEPVVESVIQSEDGDRIDSVPKRSSMYVAKAPQSFRYGMIREAYGKAQEDGILTIDSAHLLSLYGYEMHTVKSTPNNIKITASSDYYVFRALFEAIENSQIFGI
jgi:2-C-methyl-D-erythritol 4-phosphate cytidylyltransferase